MQKVTELKLFEDRVNELRDKGLVDLKFYKGEVSSADPESFSAEANQFLQAMNEGLTTPLTLGDASK